MTASPKAVMCKIKDDGLEEFLKASRRPSRVNLSQLARGVADIVLVITFAYEIGFRWFKSPREEDEEIYNLVKKSCRDTIMIILPPSDRADRIIAYKYNIIRSFSSNLESNI